MDLTKLQEETINDFKIGLKRSISQYLTWGASEMLEVIYFKVDEDVYLKAIIPDGISSDNAGMFIRSLYFRISQDGINNDILSTRFYEKMKEASGIVKIDPYA